MRQAQSSLVNAATPLATELVVQSMPNKPENRATSCNKQETKITNTSANNDSNDLGPQPDAPTCPEHGETSKAAKALDNQADKTIRTDHRWPKVMIDINALRLYITIPKPMTETALEDQFG